MSDLNQVLPSLPGRQVSFLTTGRAQTNLSRGHLRPVTASKDMILDEVDFEAPDEKKGFDLDNSDDYDTDIEIEERCPTPVDNHGAVIYRRTCRKLGIVPINSICPMLGKSTIRLRHRVIGPIGALALSNALLVNRTVTVLHLDGNNIGPNGTRYICWMLLESEIKDLSLSDNNIGHLGAGAISECLAQNKTLKKLDLSGNELGNDEAHFISQSLKINRDLSDLDLSKNSFGDDACSALGPALGSNEGLRKIDLSWNKIRTKGVSALVRGLLKNDTLETFRFSGNGTGNDGSKFIAQLLRKNVTLTELDLSENRIFDQGLVEISKAVKINKTLRILKLSRNPMTSFGALGFLETICKSKEKTLHKVDMSSTHINTDAMGKISAIKEENPEFQFLYAGTLTTKNYVGKAKADRMTDKNPLLILKWYVAAENLRLLDVFQRFDKDGSMQVSRQEFIDGLRSIQVPMTVAQIETLITQLDKDGDGEIDFAELLEGERELTRKILKADMKKKEQARLERQRQKRNEDN